MNMTLSKRGDYVVRSALCLARAYASGEHRKIREVVAEMDVPQTFASQILADLVRAGLATSQAGKAGGYRLIRPPEEVSLLEVVEAGEGPLRSERCALGDGPCRWESVCPLHETWGAATAALRETLAATSLAAIAARDEALERSEYALPTDSHRHGSTLVDIDDWVQVELPPGAIDRSLARAEAWLPACVRSGYDDAEGLRQGIDPGSLSWSPSATPVVALAACDPGRGDGTGRTLTWEAGGSRGPLSRFEGVLSVHAVDDDRSELRVAGKFRPPAAAAADPALAERLGRATMRTALREIARALEQPGDPPGGTARRARGGRVSARS
ncbi:MAG: Rrf2 family transcriptional regulator [Actinomycetota bacterium]|jgi:Rrf2 family protein|nr:Rrf2 family transcriptional regulator [Actinomycetota bacterium]